MELDLTQEELSHILPVVLLKMFFGADVSCSVHDNNRTKNILILGEGLTQGLEDIALYAEKEFPINFSAAKRRYCLSLHYNGDNSYLFVSG